ncbi:MAG: hypothetical protein ACYS26_17075, partial [Planctomycetota bacterium]
AETPTAETPTAGEPTTAAAPEAPAEESPKPDAAPEVAAAAAVAEDVVEDLELDDAELVEEAVLELEPEAPEMPAAPPKAKGGGTLARLKAQRAAERAPGESAQPKGGGTLERLKAERAAAAQAEPKQGGTLERLKAERAAAAAAPAGGSTLERLKAERAAAAAEPAPSSRGARPSRRNAEPDEDTGRGRSGGRRGGSARRSGGGGGRRGSKERNPLPGLIGIGGVLLLLGVVFVGSKQGWFDKPAPDPENTEVADAGDTETADVPVVPVSNLFDDVSSGEASAEGAGDAPTEGAGDAEGTPAEASAGTDSTDGSPANNSAPAYTGPDPASIDLTALAAYGPLEGTDDETWADIQKQVGRMADPDGGLGSSKATEKVMAWGKQAMPAIVNQLLQLDVSQAADAQSGMIVTRNLSDLLNGQPINWSEETDPRSQYNNKRAIEKIHEYWGNSIDNEKYWATWAQLDKASES